MHYRCVFGKEGVNLYFLQDKVGENGCLVAKSIKMWEEGVRGGMVEVYK